ncbi:uncharacterized protein LOC126836724 isoform X2 [Adelges cooleyi]|uniref:uncharacterized protein LOC126836724 isoform X2 n=1 Tax=Adelges cooleyi TaxID=133065 RepID=UPI00217FBC05|nr:uncharacterized protein LOC126836724 isoform X2 [Adelges cooleyi]
MAILHTKQVFALCLIICFFKQSFSTPLTEEQKMALHQNIELKKEVKKNRARVERFTDRLSRKEPKNKDNVSADEFEKIIAEDDAYMAENMEIVGRRMRIRLRQSGYPIFGDNEELIAEDMKNENEYIAARNEKLRELKKKSKRKSCLFSSLCPKKNE